MPVSRHVDIRTLFNPRLCCILMVRKYERARQSLVQKEKKNKYDWEGYLA